jgi:hypothetical protein
MSIKKNLARMASTTIGTGSVTLSSAVPGYCTFAEAGVVDGNIVSYGIQTYENGVLKDSEVGNGYYHAAGPVLDRDTIITSTNGNNAIDLTGVSYVFVTALAEDLTVFYQPIGLHGDGITDDTDAIQNAINAAHAAGGGIVFLPAGTYLLTASLVPKRGVTIRGVYPGATSTSPISWDLGFTVDTGTIITYPGGVVFQQDTSAGLGTLSSLNGVIIESLGFKNVASIITCGASNRAGLDGSVVRNIIASGVTGVAFDLINILQCHFQNIRAECKQFIRITNDYDITVIGHESGNSYFEDIYCYITAEGHDTPAIHLRSYELSGNGTQLNFIHMTRVQVNRMLSYAEAGAGHLFLEGTTNSIIYGCTFTALDLEGEAEFNVKGTNILGCNFDFVTITYRASAPAMHLRNCSHVVVKNTALDFWMDLDATNENITLIGMLAGVQGGGFRPLGFYTDRSVDTRRADYHKRIVTYAYETPDYSNLHGSGIRTSSMCAITTSGSTMWGIMDNSLYRYLLIDGSYANGGYCNNGVSVVNEWMEFDFTTARLINEINFKFSNSMSGGTFKAQGWNGASWVDIGSTFVLGAAADQFVDMSDNHYGYTKYRILGTTGNSSWDAMWQEVQFKIGNAA